MAGDDERTVHDFAVVDDCYRMDPAAVLVVAVAVVVVVVILKKRKKVQK